MLNRQTESGFVGKEFDPMKKCLRTKIMFVKLIEFDHYIISVKRILRLNSIYLKNNFFLKTNRFVVQKD
jgi:hypothetical protein